jgi:hypothetical protein
MNLAGKGAPRVNYRLGRPVDLVMDGAVENPFIQAGIERSRHLLYAA